MFFIAKTENNSFIFQCVKCRSGVAAGYLTAAQSKTRLLRKLHARFDLCLIPDWDMLYRSIIQPSLLPLPHDTFWSTAVNEYAWRTSRGWPNSQSEQQRHLVAKPVFACTVSKRARAARAIMRIHRGNRWNRVFFLICLRAVGGFLCSSSNFCVLRTWNHFAQTNVEAFFSYILMRSSCKSSERFDLRAFEGTG